MKFFGPSSLFRGRITNPNPNSDSSPIAVVTDNHSQLTGIVNHHTPEVSSSPDHDDQSDVNIEVNDESINHTATTMAATEGLLGVRERNGAVVDGPPIDDCCPICFGDFFVPCRGPCGHWYCGGCIVEYWNHVESFRPCKCPMCSREITELMPEPSLYQQEDVEVGAVLKNVKRYNRLFVGGRFGGFLQKMLQFSLFMKRVLFPAPMDPDRLLDNLSSLRWFAMLLGYLYSLLLGDFLPIDHIKLITYLDYSAFAIAFILLFAGLYHRRRRVQNVRQLAGVI